MPNLQFHLLPTLSTVLVLAHLFSDNLTDQQQQQIRLICGMVMIGSSSYFTILEFDTNLWYPVTAALLSSLAVIQSISLQIRTYLSVDKKYKPDIYRNAKISPFRIFRRRVAPRRMARIPNRSHQRIAIRP